MEYTIEQLRVEIARRAPWYQSIDFPAYGISTTDAAENALLDAAWDNKTDDITLEQAAQFRPKPKHQFIREFIPPVEGLKVLEIGSNCGFFSFEFARLGAASVTGLDVSDDWIANANWAKEVLGYKNVKFHNCDFMRYNGTEHPSAGLLSNLDTHVPLPAAIFDMVFMSTVLDHLFFPLFAIYKMCRMSRRWVVIDVPVAHGTDTGQAIARLGVPEDKSHHGFTFSVEFLRSYIARLGIPEQDIQVHLYKNGQNATYVIDTRNMVRGLHGA